MSKAIPDVPFVRFDSRDVLPSERLDYWQGSLSNVCTLSFPGDKTAADFMARNDMWLFGDMMVSRRECSPHILHRSARSIRLDQLDHYKIHFRASTAANADLEVGRRIVHVSAGECVLTDMARPELVHVEGGTTVNIIIPRDRLDPLLSRPVDLHGLTLHGPCAMLLAEHLRMITETAAGLTRVQLPGITMATLHLLAACIEPSIPALAMARPAVEVTLMRKIRRFVDANLSLPDLSADMICKSFGMSRATLYRLFEPLGGVARHIRERRLSSIHGMLSSATQRPHLGKLAMENGFRTIAQFSRAFREQFGYSPSEIITSTRLRPTTNITSGPGYSMESWLTSLRG